jgi:hypothetical protein
MNLSLKVTRIGNRWHARLLDDDKVLDEMACNSRLDLKFICKEILRRYNQCERLSRFFKAARKRQIQGPHGRVWYMTQLRRKSNDRT